MSCENAIYSRYMSSQMFTAKAVILRRKTYQVAYSIACEYLFGYLVVSSVYTVRKYQLTTSLVPVKILLYQFVLEYYSRCNKLMLIVHDLCGWIKDIVNDIYHWMLSIASTLYIAASHNITHSPCTSTCTPMQHYPPHCLPQPSSAHN